MEATSGILYAIEAGIRSKLVDMGAISIDKAATSQQANLSFKEENWIDYIAGGMFAAVKRTKDGRFYVPNFY
jgi:hypothetical protein